MIQRLSYDFQHALRFLGRRRLFAMGAVLVLAIGIGPLTALFSLMNAVLFRAWQVPDPDSVAVIRARPAGSQVYGAISIPEYRYLRDNSTTLAHLAAWNVSQAEIDDGVGQTLKVSSAFVNADYFPVLGPGMAAGRGFLAGDDDYSAPSAVAIISYRLWRSRFSGDASVIGREIQIGGLRYRIIGVAEDGFAGVDRGAYSTDLWMPLSASALRNSGPPNLARFADPRSEVRRLAGRLKAGVTREAAAAELSALSGQFRTGASVPTSGIEVIDTRPLSQAPAFVQGLFPLHARLLLAVLLVLLVACANVSNLLLSEALSRERDIAIRLSLGSSRARVVSQLLMEVGILSAAAAIVGIGLAFVVPRAMLGLGFAFGPTGFARAPNAIAEGARASFFAPDAQVWLFAVLLACVTTVFAALPAALWVGRVSLAALAASRHGRTVRRARIRVVLLSSQIAVTMVLLVAAVTLTRAVANATSLSPGFTIEGLQVVSVEAGPAVRAQTARVKAFYHGLMDGLEAANIGPAAISDLRPFSDISISMMVRRPDESAGASRPIPMRPVSRNYFAVMGISLVRGRAAASDTDSHELVVSEAAARALWPGADPIGQTLLSALSQTEFEPYQVVGVARDTPVRSMSEIEPIVYRAPSWRPAAAYLLVRNPSPAVADRVRAVATSLESEITVTTRPFSDFVRDALETAVIAGRGAWGIGVLGLVLAIVGAFGVFAHEVQERRYEIGIRRAVGASGQAVATLLMRSASKALMWGMAAGFVLSLLAKPLIEHFLYGLSPFDLIAYAEVGGILTLATALATWVPTRRAISVDPASTLRGD